MPTVNLTSKYLEDAQGNKYAPVTVPSAVRWANGDDLDDKLAAKQAVIDSSNKLPASNVSGLATVATSGSYNDLSNTPTIPDAQIQSDWNQTSTTAKDYIKNKPSVFSASANGLAPAASNANKTTAESSQSKYYLCEDGKYRQLPVTAFSSGGKITPIVGLGQPSGDTYALSIVFDPSTSKFYQYLWDDNQGIATWQEIATLEKAFGFYNDGQGNYGYYEIDNGVLSQTPISVLEAGWYSDFAGIWAQSVGHAGVIMYFDESGNDYRTVSYNETYRWDNKSDFSGDYNDLSNKPTIPTYSVMGASGSSHASGLTPDTPSTAGTTKFLREDGTWNEPNYPTTLPASDVYDWAKAASKPSYKMSEVADISVVAISTNTTSVCTIRGSNNHGKSQTIIYTNSTNSDLYVTVPTHYVTPEIMPTPSGSEIILLCPAGGYCEVNYLNVNGTIYSRGL